MKRHIRFAWRALIWVVVIFAVVLTPHIGWNNLYAHYAAQESTDNLRDLTVRNAERLNAQDKRIDALEQMRPDANFTLLNAKLDAMAWGVKFVATEGFGIIVAVIVWLWKRKSDPRLTRRGPRV